MKMSDMFDLPLDCLLVGNEDIGYAVELERDKSVTEDQAYAVDYAINNHDRMVEEIAELKGALLEIKNTPDVQCDECPSIASAALAKLNQEGEE